MNKKYEWNKTLQPVRNIFDSGAQVIVNPVNCVGVMRAGLAKEFKKRYPVMFAEYKTACSFGRYKPGYCFLSHMNDGQWIANIPTKDHWKDPSQKKWIIEGVRNLIEDMNKSGGFYREDRLRSVAIPRIGCGLGGLNWDDIRPKIIRELKGCRFDVWLDGEVFLRNKDGINEMKSTKTNTPAKLGYKNTKKENGQNENTL